MKKLTTLFAIAILILVVFSPVAFAQRNFRQRSRNEGLSGEIIAFYGGEDNVSVVKKEHQLTAIPYYAWANRGPGEMSVWLARDKSRVRLTPVPSIASRSRASSSCGKGTFRDNYPGGNLPDIARRFYPQSQSGSGHIEALFDQVTPVNSLDGSSTFLRLRPQSRDQAWVQYDFENTAEVSSVNVYWKDDKEYC